MNNDDKVFFGLGCVAVAAWLAWVGFWVFFLVMIAADFLDLGIAITDKL